MFKKTLLVLFLFSLFSFSANRSSFTGQELLELSPFDKQVQFTILNDLFKFYNLEYDETIPLPKILISEEVEESEVEIVEAVESQGMPYWALAKGVNIFLKDKNIILIGKNKSIHNLAHEYAHYIQVYYQGYDGTNDPYDRLETEAVRMQNFFRD